MQQNSDRWNEVSRSAFEHEKLGLELLARAVPDSAPYRVWANFEFQDGHGQWHEVDAMVVGQSRIHLLELKSYRGRLGGDEHRWVTDREGRLSRMRSPLVTTRRKAQRLKSKLEEEFSRIALDQNNSPQVRQAATQFGRVPWIQEAVFLHNPELESILPPGKAHNIFGVDPADFPTQHVETGLPPIAERIQEPAGRDRISENQSVLIAIAMQKIAGIAVRDQLAGSFLLHDRIASDDARFHLWDGEHKDTGDPITARILNVDLTTSEGERKLMRQLLRREYDLLAGLNHQNIVAPRSRETLQGTSDDVVIYPALPDFQPLDVALPDAQLTAGERADIVHQVASALLYAHQHQVVHRSLDPKTVLLNSDRLTSIHVGRPGRIEVKVDGWFHAGSAETAGTVLGSTGLSTTRVDEDSSALAYAAPELSVSRAPDRLAADLFSLGAVAYYVLTGGEDPAPDRSALLDRLERDRGLDVTAVTNEFDQGLRRLIKQATAPVVTERLKPFLPDNALPGDTPVRAFKDLWINTASADTPSQSDAQMDALAPMIDGLIADRFVVKQVLGSGSTALGILVEDTDGPTRVKKVLKVARDERAAARLRDEAEVLRSLARGLPSRYEKLFVALLEDPLVVPRDRTCLVLSNCGTVTLASALQLGALQQDHFWAFAANLADMLVALEAAGVTHRDIKPANLGILRPGGHRHLALFDFSASRESVQHTEVGTGAYRDPFLGRHSRTTADSSAERYAVGVVLFEMATGTKPIYGDGLSDPSLTDGVVAIDRAQLPAEWSDEVAEAMSGLFQRLLGGDESARFGSAEELRDGLAAASALYRGSSPRGSVGGVDDDERTATSSSTRHGTDSPSTPTTTGETTATVVPLPALPELADELVARSGGSRSSDYRLVRAILGRSDAAPDDPFQAMAGFAAPLKLSAGRIPQLTGKFPDLWTASPSLRRAFDEIRGATRREIVRRGGVASIRQIAAALESSFGSVPGRRREEDERLRLGVLRMFDLGVHRAKDAEESGLELIRRGRGGRVIGMTLHLSWARPLASELNQAARDLLAEPGVRLVAAENVDVELGAVAQRIVHSVSDDRIDPLTLRELAVAGDDEVALTTAGELYSTSMELRDLIALTLPRAAQHFSLELLRDSIKARFPELRLRDPRREEVDAALAEHMPGMTWDAKKGIYSYSDAPTGLSMVHTRTPSAHTAVRRQHDDPLVEQIARTAAAGGFRSVSVPYGRSDRIAEQLADRLGGERVDLAEKVLDRLDTLLEESGQADKRAEFYRLPPEQLRSVMESNVRSVLDQVDATPASAVVLTEASLLAEYGLLDQLNRWTGLASAPRRPVVLISGRATDAPGQPDLVDGEKLPITSDSQLVSV